MDSTKKIFLISLILLFIGCSSESSTQEVSKDNRVQMPTSTPIITPTTTITPTPPNHKDVNSSRENNLENNHSTQTTQIEETQNSNTNQQTIPLHPTPNISELENSTIANTNSNSNSNPNYLNSCNQVVDKEFFKVCYSYDLKVAKSVSYRLEGDLVNELNIKDRPRFYEEELIPEEYRAEYSDYTNSGYDRGHMAPDASFDWSIESLEATYSLANIIPQVPEVNRYGWAKLEQYVRDQAVELGYIDVINVVEYEDTPQRIGENQIAVSTGYYKILINKDENYKECFYYKNEETTTNSDNVDEHRVDCNRIR